MVSTEVLLLTGAVVVADVIALHEYLRMEDKLARVRAEKAANQRQLGEFVAEVNEPAQHGAGELTPTATKPQAMTSDEKDRAALEQENLQLKAKADALEQSRREMHRTALENISSKIDAVMQSISDVKQKVAASASGEATVVKG